MSNFSQFLGSGGIGVGEPDNYNYVVQGPNPIIGTKEFLLQGFWKPYDSSYLPAITSNKSLGFINCSANSDIGNSNSTRSWANVMSCAQYYGWETGANPTYGATMGTPCKVEKSNTDYIMIQFFPFCPQYSASYYQVVNSPGVSTSSFPGSGSGLPCFFKYGPDINSLATGNGAINMPETFTEGDTGSNYVFAGTQPGGGYYDSITFKGNVFVCGGYINVTSVIAGTTATRGTIKAQSFIYVCNTNTFTGKVNTSFGIVANNTGNSSQPAIYSGYYTTPGYGTPYLGNNQFTYTAFASNGSHVLAHSHFIANGNSGRIMTSTDGNTWTARSMTGAPLINVVRTTYSNAGNCYVFVTNSCGIYVSTDGFTLTQKTTPVGAPAIANAVPTVAGQSAYSATSNANTIILLNTRQMIWTNDGNTFNYTDMTQTANLGIFGFTNNISTVYDGARFIIMGTNGMTAYSDNDGASWKLDYTKISTNTSNISLTYSSYYGLSNVGGNVVCINHDSSSKYYLPILLSSTTAQSTPTFVGVPTYTVGSYKPTTGVYMRIK